MLREQTCFINNAIGVDPDDCGCTDCIVGNSIPLSDAAAIEALVEAHFEEGREIINRTGCTMVAFRTSDGTYGREDVPVSGAGTSFNVIAPEGGYIRYSTDAGTVISDGSTSKDEALGAVGVEDGEAMKETVERHFRYGEIIINRTARTLLLYGTHYGEFGHLSLDTDRDDPVVSVLPYH